MQDFLTFGLFHFPQLRRLQLIKQTRIPPIMLKVAKVHIGKIRVNGNRVSAGLPVNLTYNVTRFEANCYGI